MDIDKVLNYCRQHCGELTTEQENMVRFCVKKDRFIGVGRAMGRSVLSPLVFVGDNQKICNVINKAGHYDLSGVLGRHYFKESI